MERSFWTDALLVVVTLGLYMIYWFYERNKRLRESHPQLELADNLWWLVGGGVLSILGAVVAFTDPFFSTLIQAVAIGVFSIGVLLLVRNGESAAEAEGLEWTIPAPFAAGLFAAAFLMVQLGNVFTGLAPRAFALLLLLSLPVLFYRVWEDLDLVIPDARPAPPAATS